MKTNLKTFYGIKAGQKFKVINYEGDHNYPVGKTLTFKHDGTKTNRMFDCAQEVVAGHVLYIDQIILINLTVKGMEEKINLLNKKVKVLNDKVAYCRKYKLTEYDEDYVKVMKALETIDSDSSISEKARIITALLKD